MILDVLKEFKEPISTTTLRHALMRKGYGSNQLKFFEEIWPLIRADLVGFYDIEGIRYYFKIDQRNTVHQPTDVAKPNG